MLRAVRAQERHNLPDVLDLFLLVLALAFLPTPNVHVSNFLLTSFYPHELIKLKYPTLAASPSLTTLMENRLSRMVYAFLSFS